MEKNTKFLLRYDSTFRGGHEETAFRFNKDGWLVDDLFGHEVQCQPDGSPQLYSETGNFKHDAVYYPSGLPSKLETLWIQISNGKLVSDDEIQNRFNELGTWISICETSQPEW